MNIPTLIKYKERKESKYVFYTIYISGIVITEEKGKLERVCSLIENMYKKFTIKTDHLEELSSHIKPIDELRGS